MNDFTNLKLNPKKIELLHDETVAVEIIDLAHLPLLEKLLRMAFPFDWSDINVEPRRYYYGLNQEFWVGTDNGNLHNIAAIKPVLWFYE